jgi:predicted DNA-binding ribbon-helix-helix protein
MDYRISPIEGARRKSAIVRRYVTISGRNSSVSLESAFWDALKEIADLRGTTRVTIVSTIESEGRPGNLSSAIRLFVLDHYRALAERRTDCHATKMAARLN